MMIPISLTIKYRNYPLAPKLTKKSQRIGSFTHPIFGFALGSMVPTSFSLLLMWLSDIFPSAQEVLKTLGHYILTFGGIAGMIAGPILIVRYRKKKFDQLDVEYGKILLAMEANQK
mgnify:FL=1